MTTEEALESTMERLAERCSLVPDYDDIWGQRHAISAETRRDLLRAMGLPVDDPEAAARALVQREERPFRRAMEPVRVVPQGEPEASAWVALPVGQTAPLFWRVTEEDGQTHGGLLDPDALTERERREVDGQPVARHTFPLPVDLEPGYHRLELLRGGEAGESLGETRLIITPRRCHEPAALAGEGRIFGVAAQLYGVRSATNWGVGDFTDLGELLALCAARGAEVVGLNPLHALFPHNPRHESPYAPSSRLFLAIHYIDVTAVPELPECPEARAMAEDPALLRRVETLRRAELVDYQGVAELKRPVLERLCRHFRQEHLAQNTPRARAFQAFVDQGGEALRLQAVHEALQEHFSSRTPALGAWFLWPEPYRDPRSPEVGQFARDHADRVELFLYLQWLADEQLAAAAARGRHLGMALGLYRDLAVSVDRAGAEVWMQPGAFALEASVGAPPDALGPRGQNWGLPPLIPEQLKERAYAPFIQVLRQNMRHAGALRIDHVMGLMRLFWIPPHKDATEGAYMAYPFDDLLGIVALESQRHRCLIIGEDLGTVPDQVRQRLQEAGVLSYRVLYFEQDAEGYLPPERFPRQALVTVSTHDLPTLVGFWQGRDLALRDELSLFPSPEARQRMIHDRQRERGHMLRRLRDQGLLPEGISDDPAQVPVMTPALCRAAHRHLARTPSQLMVVQLEDLLMQLDQANLPATTFEQPNWRRRLRLTLQELTHDPVANEVLAAVARERPPARDHDPHPCL